MEGEIATESQEVQDGDSGASASSIGGPRRRLYRLGKALYRAVPPRLRAFIYPIAANAVLLRRLRPEVWVVSGEERRTHLPLSVCLYAVTEEYRSALQGVIFASSQATYLGRGWLWNAFRALPRAAGECSAIIAEVHERHVRWAGQNPGIVIPAWVRGHVPLPRSAAVMRRFSIKNTLRKIRQQRLDYYVTRDPKSFDDFYGRMYVPYAKARFGNGAFIFPRDRVRAMFDQGELVMVRKEGKDVAGELVVYRKDNSAFMPLLGVLDGSWELVTEGTLAATYEFTLQHLEKSGYRSVDFGRTQGFLNDGVLVFKKKFGHIISGTTEHKYIVRILSDTRAVKAFLQSNPFIFQLGDGLRGAVFIDHEFPTHQALQEVYKEYFQLGLLEMIVFFLSAERRGVDGGEPERAPIDFSIPPTDSSQNGPSYRLLKKAEYDDIIRALGPLRVAAAVAIRP